MIQLDVNVAVKPIGTALAAVSQGARRRFPRRTAWLQWLVDACTLTFAAQILAARQHR